NPPIRSEEDRLALLAGIKDGTVDMIITDHAPHSAEEKSRGLAGSLMGVVGLETSFPVMYTKLVKTGELTLEDLMRLMHDAPMNRFCVGAPLEEGQPADLTVFDLNASFTVDPNRFLSRGRATPFHGEVLQGVCRMTMVNGNVVYRDSQYN
ncbi:MAG: amidohydrolase family protein, partial [Lachnospiraceae bacterium]|nr:amidohydrolase family protein [Lachnospiraceae bacterium]